MVPSKRWLVQVVTALVASFSVLSVAAFADTSPAKSDARASGALRRSEAARSTRDLLAAPPPYGLAPVGLPESTRPSPYQPLLDAGGLVRLHPLGQNAPFITLGGTLNARLYTDPVTGAPVWRNDDFHPTITFGKKL